jgi:hypothetical protein
MVSITALDHFWNGHQKYKIWIHAIIPESTWDAYLTVLNKFDVKTFGVSCKCHTNVDGEPHYHLLWAADKDFKNAICCRLRRLKLEQMKVRRCYQRTITSKVHLINTILYIQTEETKGWHTGTLEDCHHYEHENNRIFHTIKDQRMRRAEYNMHNIEYREQHKKEWDAFKLTRIVKRCDNWLFQ